MALNSGPLPKGTPESVALPDYNAAMEQLDAAFPLKAEDLDSNSVETDKIKDANVTLPKVANIAEYRMLGNDTEEEGPVKELTVSEVKSLLGGAVYVPVAGGNTYLKVVGNFITDGTVKVDGLDLSPYIPPDAVAVQLIINILDNASGSIFYVRSNAANIVNNAYLVTNASGRYASGQFILANIDQDGKFDYFGSNLAFTEINVDIIGYWH